MNDTERYLFDLQGYLVLKGVVPAAILQACNAALDRFEHWSETEYPPPLCLGQVRSEQNLYISNIIEGEDVFLDLMDIGKVDIAQPDVGRVGGLTEALRVCDLAAERGRRIIPHCWKTGISIAASAHLAAVTPHCPYFEFLPAELTDSLLRKELVKDEIRLIDGKLSIPRKPGLGIEVDMDALRSFEQD